MEEGEKSLIVQGYDIACACFFSVYNPLMERQLQYKKSVASKIEETGPSVEESEEREAEEDKVNSAQRDSDPTPTKDPPAKPKSPISDAKPPAKETPTKKTSPN